MLLVITPPNRPVRLGQGMAPAHPVYRVGQNMQLLRMGQSNPRGGVMVLDTCGADRRADPSGLCRQVVRECGMRGFCGVVCTGSAAPQPFAARLDEVLAGRGIELCVPEFWGPYTQRARVLIPSALSGGSLACRLQEAAERFGGPERIALRVERVAEDFFLPAPKGSGTPLTGQELSRLTERLKPSIFFSEELCARYFTYMTGEGGAHFVLFDDGATIRKKLQVARKLGICRGVARWEDVADLPPEK